MLKITSNVKDKPARVNIYPSWFSILENFFEKRFYTCLIFVNSDISLLIVHKSSTQMS